MLYCVTVSLHLLMLKAVACTEEVTACTEVKFFLSLSPSHFHSPLYVLITDATSYSVGIYLYKMWRVSCFDSCENVRVCVTPKSGPASQPCAVWLWENFKVMIVLDTQTVINVFYAVVVSELYLFTLVSLTLTLFQGHSSALKSQWCQM